jgi:hypothetical protein
VSETWTVERLFRAFFLPLYPPDAAADLARARTIDANPACNPAVLAHLDEAASIFAARAPALLDLQLDFSDASVHRVGAAFTRERREAWMARGTAGSSESELFNVVVHGAAYVGTCIVRNHGGTWGVRRPLWESVVRLRSHAGEADLAVFHWWLKSLADDGVGASLGDRYRSYVEVPRTNADALPILVKDAQRSLPRLKRPRYDVFYKYLKAHLPEVRDLGADFPSPERFDDLAPRWIDFHVVGGGRMLLITFATAHGVHLFWLGDGGFVKAAWYEADAFPDPVTKVESDRVKLIVSASGNTRVHEMLWWGP